MEIRENKTIDGLTQNSVSVLTKKMVEIDGQEQQLGDNHRIAYMNDEFGRNELMANQPIEVINAVMAIWGEEPTIKQPETEPEIIETEPEIEIEMEPETETEIETESEMHDEFSE